MIIKIFAITFFMFTISLCKGQQTSTYIGHATIKSNIKARTLIDSLTQTRYVLDTANIYVTAISASGKQLWRTDPYKDSNLEEYRVKRPVIVVFKLGKTQNPDSNGKEVILIVYNNTHFGFIDKRTGKFFSQGQD